MNQINFLPQSYIRERRRQLRVMRETMLIAIVGVLIIIWYIGTQTRVGALENLVQAREQEARSIASQQTEMARLDQQREVLMHQLRLERELSSPISHTAVVATLASIMPRSMALTDMSIDMPAPAPRQPPKVQTTDQTSQQRHRAKLAAFSKPTPMMHVAVVGLAASDMDIADFVGHLTEHPLFGNVKMVFSRSIELKDQQVMGREFRVEMDIRLDRMYVSPQGADANGMTTQGTLGGVRGNQGGLAHVD